MIKVIILDIGGVLISSERSFDGIYEEFAKAIGAPPEKMVKLHNQYLDRMLYGKISAAQFFSLIKKKFHVKGDLKKKWIAVAKKNIKINKELLATVDKLRARYPMVLLSNVSQIRSFMDEEFDLYSHFDRAFLSYKLKMQKPSKKIFAYALKKLKVKPQEVLFIDDKTSNLQVARELGMVCIQFNNNAQLMTELAPLGLL
jgi:putative hydrolase of the HAD superfamily